MGVTLGPRRLGPLTPLVDLHLRLAATGEEMHHTDANTLRLVRRFHPGTEGG